MVLNWSIFFCHFKTTCDDSGQKHSQKTKKKWPTAWCDLQWQQRTNTSSKTWQQPPKQRTFSCSSWHRIWRLARFRAHVKAFSTICNELEKSANASSHFHYCIGPPLPTELNPGGMIWVAAGGMIWVALQACNGLNRKVTDQLFPCVIESNKIDLDCFSLLARIQPAVFNFAPILMGNCPPQENGPSKICVLMNLSYLQNSKTSQPMFVIQFQNHGWWRKAPVVVCWRH